LCPRCGAPVGIPSLKTTHPGAAQGPMTPTERLAKRFVTVSKPLAQEFQRTPPDVQNHPPQEPRGAELSGIPMPRPLDPSETPVIVLDKMQPGPRRARPNLPLACLGYVLRNWPLILGLAGALTLLTIAILAAILPGLSAQLASISSFSQPPLLQLLLLLLFMLFLLSFVGCLCALAGSALTSGPNDEWRPALWPLWNLRHVASSSLIWLVCFLAGPIVPAGMALLYWLQCGDPIWLDWSILGELGILTISYWLFVVLAFSRGNQLRALNPIYVADMIHGMSKKALAIVFLSACLALAHGGLVLAGMVELQQEDSSGLLWIVIGCLSGLFWAGFLLRILDCQQRLQMNLH
jgi:hypothetical protein